MNLTEFTQDDFLYSESEEGIKFCKADKENGLAPVIFWIYASAFIEDDPMDDLKHFCKQMLDSDYLYKNIDANMAVALLKDKVNGLKMPQDFPLEYSEIIAATLMIDDWDMKEIIGETENSFFLFVWETSA